MKQYIIIFQNKVTRFKKNYFLPIKQTWEISKTHVQIISPEAGARWLEIVRNEVYINKFP